MFKQEEEHYSSTSGTGDLTQVGEVGRCSSRREEHRSSTSGTGDLAQVGEVGRCSSRRKEHTSSTSGTGDQVWESALWFSSDSLIFCEQESDLLVKKSEWIPSLFCHD